MSGGNYYLNGFEVEVKRLAISLADSGDLVAAVSGRKIRVLSLLLMADADQTAKFQSGASSDLTGALPVGQRGGCVLPHNPLGWMETAAGEKLNLVALVAKVASRTAQVLA